MRKLELLLERGRLFSLRVHLKLHQVELDLVTVHFRRLSSLDFRDSLEKLLDLWFGCRNLLFF